MIFRASGFEAFTLEFLRRILELTKAPVSVDDFRHLYFYGKYYGFFPYAAKALSRDSWGQFGAFLIQALSAGRDAALVELVELWKQVYDVVANYESSVAPVGACVTPGEFSSMDVEGGGEDVPLSEAEMCSIPARELGRHRHQSGANTLPPLVNANTPPHRIYAS
ncbi:hypothetical protein HGM15179_020359 [Zosterops borbonicus]|uniref:Uncharacterized protein n=1 Tax=Zosterops borbonicus TaxID=364589 RepID=A0A8K1D733_9PASS|nr:hypothetical protein HGM15179_020359 [Zosterops borbonicus]